MKIDKGFFLKLSLVILLSRAQVVFPQAISQHIVPNEASEEKACRLFSYTPPNISKREPGSILLTDVTSTVPNRPAGITVDIESTITLDLPLDDITLDACSIYSIPAFKWSAEEAFNGYEIQFSLDSSFASLIKINTSATEATLTSNTWKKVLSLPGFFGGTIYWRVIGTRANKGQAFSEVRSFAVRASLPVENPLILASAKGSFPQLSWQNNCNKKHKVYFAGSQEFDKAISFTFNVKNPIENGGQFVATLTSNNLNSIKKLAGGDSKSSIYWYVESWDELKRNSKTDVLFFDLSEIDCTFSVSPNNQSVGPEGGQLTINVATEENCKWSVTSNDPWIVLNSDSIESGNGIVAFSVLPNNCSTPRNGTLTVAGLTIAVKQSESEMPPNIFVRLPGPQGAAPPNVIAIDPNDDSKVYVGGRGYFFRSNDGGANWEAIQFDTWGNGLIHDVSAIAVDPKSSSILYIGTYKWSQNSRVAKSIDYGKTWAWLDLDITSDLIAIDVDPINASVVYVGTSKEGIYKSINGGQTWLPSNGGLTDLDVNTILINKNNPSVVYAGTRTGIFKSSDYGSTWKNISNQIGEGPVDSIDGQFSSGNNVLVVTVALDYTKYNSNYGISAIPRIGVTKDRGKATKRRRDGVGQALEGIKGRKGKLEHFRSGDFNQKAKGSP